MAKATVTLPKGTLVWPKLSTPDDYKGKKTYKTNIQFNDEDHRKVDAWLKAVAKDQGFPKSKLPWKTDKDGAVTLSAKSGEDKPPPFVDAKGHPVPRSKVQIGGGTIARVGVAARAYDNGFLTLYITGVQIIELKSKGGFEVEPEEGFSWDGGADEEPEATEAPAATEEDDDIF